MNANGNGNGNGNGSRKCSGCSHVHSTVTDYCAEWDRDPMTGRDYKCTCRGPLPQPKAKSPRRKSDDDLLTEMYERKARGEEV